MMSRPHCSACAGASRSSNAIGEANTGNDTTRHVTALIRCLPYIGFPRALDAIRIVNDLA
jgi:hypothetical protein